MSEFVNPVTPPLGLAPGDGERTYAMFTHLSSFLGYLVGPLVIIAPLVMWLIKKDESAYISDHGREAVNFNISLWIYMFVAGLLTLACVGYVMLPALFVFNIVIVIIAAIRANSGAYYRYPITMRFIRS